MLLKIISLRPSENFKFNNHQGAQLYDLRYIKYKKKRKRNYKITKVKKKYKD